MVGHVALGGFDPSTWLPLPPLTQNILRITFLDVLFCSGASAV